MRDVHVWFVFKENWQEMTASETAILQKKNHFHVKSFSVNLYGWPVTMGT